MSLFGHLLGTERPSIPAGGRAFLWPVADGGWHVHVADAGQEQGEACRKVGPHFDVQDEAEKYLAWVNGGPAYHYPPGGV